MVDDVLVRVTQADWDLIELLMRPAVRNEIESLALDYIQDGRGDDAEAVQAIARHRIEGTAALKAELAEVREHLETALQTLNIEGCCSEECPACSDARATLSRSGGVK